MTATQAVVPSGISGIANKDMIELRNIPKYGVKDHTIIYDDDSDTGWLTSYSSLYILLVQLYLLRKDAPWAELSANTLAEAKSDGGSAASETMLGWLDMEQKTPQIEDGLIQFLKPICYHVRRVEHQLREIYTQFPKAAPEKILGVEIVDVALMKASIPVKKAKVKNPWTSIPEHPPCFVLFCKNLGQAIVPASTRGLCQEFTSVPEHRSYLVATGPSLIYMLEKRTQRKIPRLADRITWDFRKPLVNTHKSGTVTACDHLQYLHSKVPGKNQEGLQEALECSKDGGYIFHNLKYWAPPKTAGPVSIARGSG